MSQITVYRRGDKRWERAVQLRQGGNTWHIDPQTEILQATGTWINRYWCIASFMYGLSYAGLDVHEDRCFGGAWRNVQRIDRHPGQVVHAYFFLGLAWGMNKWEETKRQLRQLPKRQRLTALERAGKYYLNHHSRWSTPSTLSLHLPL